MKCAAVQCVPRRPLFPLFSCAAALLVLTVILVTIGSLLFHITLPEALAILDDKEVLAALRVTLLSSALSTLCVLTLGIPAAYALSRYLGRWRFICELILELPLLLPPLVAGLALLLAFGRQGTLGAWLALCGVRIPFSLAAVVLAQVFLLTPFFVKRAAHIFDAVNRRREDASALLGADPWFTFRHLTLPLCRRSLGAEAITVIAQGLGMFGAVLLFAGNLPGRTQTLTLAVYAAFAGQPDKAIALAVLLLLISLALLTLIKFLGRGVNNAQHSGAS